MKLQPTSKKEVQRIAIGTYVCAAMMTAVLFLLSLFGVGTFSYRVIIGAVCGSAVGVLNFAIMCLTVQKAVGIEDKKQMKAFIQGSYNGRLLLQAGWVVACYFIPFVHLIAGALPLLFPSVVIYFLQSRGKLMPPDPPRDPSKVPADEEEEEDNLGPFEV